MTYRLCDTCRGRGEVSLDTKTDWIEGRVKLNAAAYDEKLGEPRDTEQAWILDLNPLVPAWSVAVCMMCHGTGMHPKQNPQPKPGVSENRIG